MTTRYGPEDGRPDPGLNAITAERRQLMNLAYRLLSSLTEAKDAVQETYARWYAMSPRQQDAIASRPGHCDGRPVRSAFWAELRRSPLRWWLPALIVLNIFILS